MVDIKMLLSILQYYVTPLTWICLSRVFPRLNEVFPEALTMITRRAVRQQLVKHRVESILPVLERSPHCFITGGFLVAALCGDDHDECSDLDIIVTREIVSSQIKQFGKVSKADTPPYNIPDLKSLHNVFSKRTDGDGYGGLIQLLHVAAPQVYAFVSRFDFAFCRSCFNYKTGQLFVTPSWESLVYRSASINVDTMHHHFLPGPQLESFATRTYGRVLKYHERGFSVTVEQQLNASELFEQMCRTYADFPEPTPTVSAIRDAADWWHAFWQKAREDLQKNSSSDLVMMKKCRNT